MKVRLEIEHEEAEVQTVRKEEFEVDAANPLTFGRTEQNRLQIRGVPAIISSNAWSRSGAMLGEAGSASTSSESSTEVISGTKPKITSRFAVSGPCSSATALDTETSSRKAKIPASTASGPTPARVPISEIGPSETCLLPSTPAMQTMPP